MQKNCRDSNCCSNKIHFINKRDSSLSIFEEENLRFRRVNGKINEDIYDSLFRCETTNDRRS